MQASVPGGGEASGMWLVSGLILSLSLALVAWLRSRSRSTTYYEGEVYGVSSAGHRYYALAFLGLGASLLASSAAPPATVPLLAILALAAVLYGATFLRGASGEDE